jgi:hypothetical protein
MIQADISELPTAVRRELCAGRMMRQVADMEDAFVRQRQSAAAVGEHRSIDGLGRLRMIIDPTAYHYWGQRLGYACWSDPQFLREYERDNPEVRVKCGGTRIQSGWTPSTIAIPSLDRSRRSRKSYGP